MKVHEGSAIWFLVLTYSFSGIHKSAAEGCAVSNVVWASSPLKARGWLALYRPITATLRHGTWTAGPRHCMCYSCWWYGVHEWCFSRTCNQKIYKYIWVYRVVMLEQLQVNLSLLGDCVNHRISMKPPWSQQLWLQRHDIQYMPSVS